MAGLIEFNKRDALLKKRTIGADHQMNLMNESLTSLAYFNILMPNGWKERFSDFGGLINQRLRDFNFVH